jgi:hypothetical protein
MMNDYESTSYEKLLIRQTKSMKWKSEQLCAVNPPYKHLRGTIVHISYASFGVLLDDYSKVVYVHRFPPVEGTVPNLDEESDIEECKEQDITVEEFINFWSDPSQKQVNGNDKGGSWGLDNFIYCSTWMTQGFIGKRVEIEFMANGILNFDFSGKPFTSNSVVRHGSENTTWSCNVTLEETGKTYSSYILDYYMGQYANDVLFVWHDPDTNIKLVKILKRGNAPTVDMQNKYMPGAGEHLEPGEKLKFKNNVKRSVEEEMGAGDILEKSFVISLGKFDDENRDPRYAPYTTIKQDGTQKTFGAPRYSTSNGYVLYYKGDAPKLKQASDTTEVVEMGPNEKKWLPLDTLDTTEDNWMMADHAKIVQRTKETLIEFDLLSPEVQEEFRYKEDDSQEIRSL